MLIQGTHMPEEMSAKPGIMFGMQTLELPFP